MNRTEGMRTERNTAYDYANQAWVVDGRYVACAHPESMQCKCYGKLHAGEVAPPQCEACGVVKCAPRDDGSVCDCEPVG